MSVQFLLKNDARKALLIFAAFELLMRFLFFLIGYFALQPCFAQYSDSIHHRLQVSSTGNLNRTVDGQSYLFNNAVNFGIRKKKFEFNASNGWVYGSNTEKLSNNDFTSTLDFNLYQTPRFYYWGLGAYTTSYSLNINNRVQGGLGVAYDFFDSEDIRLNISEGALFEYGEVMIPDSSMRYYHIIRNSLRLKFMYRVEDRFKISASGFWQPSFEDFNDYLLNGDLTISWRLYKWINLSAGAKYEKVTLTNRENVLLTYGIVLERFF